MDKLKVLKKVCNKRGLNWKGFYENEGINTIDGWVSFDDLKDETFKDEIGKIIDEHLENLWNKIIPAVN